MKRASLPYMNCNLKPQSNSPGWGASARSKLITAWFSSGSFAAIIKEPSEVLIVLRAGGIEADPTVDPTGNLKAWRRSGRSRFDFAGNSHCGQIKRKRNTK